MSLAANNLIRRESCAGRLEITLTTIVVVCLHDISYSSRVVLFFMLVLLPLPVLL